MKTLIKSDRYQEDVLETYLTPAYSEDRLYDDLYDCQKHNYLVRKYFKEGLRGDDLINAVTDTINEDIADWDCTAWQGLDEEADEFDPQDLYDESIQSSRHITSAYEDSEVVFRATTRGGKYFVEITDTGDSVDRYRIEQDGAVNYADDINGILGDLVKQSSYGEGTFDKIEVDNLNIGKRYLGILKNIKSKYGFLEKSEKGSDTRQFYFRLMRWFGNKLKTAKGNYPEDDIFEAADALLKSKGLMSSRRIRSSQKGFENVADNTQYDDYHIDTRGMGILDVENIVDAIESRGNQAVLTVNCSDGSAYHTQFTLKDWKEFKESKNANGAQVTDVWITEVKPTYTR